TLDATAADSLRPLLDERPDVLLLAVPEAALPALREAAHAEAPAARVATLRAPVSGAAGGLVFACDWHGELSRYGAAQLNERFARRSGAAMDERAWSGWLAVKLASEAQLRGGPEDRIARIAAARTDGHAGAPLRFRRDDRHLDTAVHVVGPPRDATRGPARILATLAPGEEA
ncbi:MAG TPA: hypothetical protein VLC53_17410, partial [Myxococcota bacterium]|nr:hypothetical protein [Myxococcota bacterium]